MQRDERRLLKEQLEQALAEMDASARAAEPMEIATLGGLLLRERQGAAAADPDDSKLLERAHRHNDAARQAMAEVLAESGVSGLVEELISLSEEDDPAQRADVLFELDEFLVGAWFCGFAAAELDEAADWVVQTIHASPELFADLSEMATIILSRYPELEPASARRVWQAIEASQWKEEEEPTSLPACTKARMVLGLPLVAVNSALKMPVRLASSAEALPASPAWQTLDRSDGWELALTLDEADQPILLFSTLNAELPMRVVRDECEVTIQSPRRGVRTWPAIPGSYHLQIADEQRTIEVEP